MENQTTITDAVMNNEHLTNLMISGGTVIPLAALAARTLNAGSTNAGTLDEAKRLGRRSCKIEFK